MRIFFVSNDFAGASLARRLVLEGHEVRAYVADPACERIMLGLIPRLPSLDAGFDWDFHPANAAFPKLFTGRRPYP